MDRYAVRCSMCEHPHFVIVRDHVFCRRCGIIQSCFGWMWPKTKGLAGATGTGGNADG